MGLVCVWRHCTKNSIDGELTVSVQRKRATAMPTAPSKTTAAHAPMTAESFNLKLSRAVAGANLVLADPPWKYGRDAASNGWHGSARRHYTAMTQRELCALEIGEHTAKDAVALVWATSSKLGEAIEIIEAWGFAFRGVFLTWVKTDKSVTKPVLGLGRYTRSSTEFLLFGIKGEVQKGRLMTGATNASGLLFQPRGVHSAKPAEVYERIAEVFGGPGVKRRVELFARALNPPPQGWDVWGDESQWTEGEGEGAGAADRDSDADLQRNLKAMDRDAKETNVGAMPGMHWHATDNKSSRRSGTLLDWLVAPPASVHYGEASGQ